MGMRDIHDSESWRRAYSTKGVFEGDCHGISLALCTDEVNPFSHNKVSYSMWPIVLAILNRERYSFVMVGIVPGNGNKEANSLDPYLDILVEVYKCANFSMKVELLLYILDYPAIGKVFNVMGTGGYRACAWCELEGMLLFAMYVCNAFRFPARHANCYYSGTSE